MTLMSVMPISIYQNGLPRLWNRRVKEDFWQKELEHIGEQEILIKELYAKASNRMKFLAIKIGMMNTVRINLLFLVNSVIC